MRDYVVLIAALLAGTASVAPVVAIAQAAPQPDNAEIQALFAADQAVRQGLSARKIDRAFAVKMVADDRERRAAAKRLLDTGALHTGADYYAAAFIFQHGSSSDDYLLAHSLALAAVAKGKADATWIAAATLDRYLQTIGQKQIYGTQFIAGKQGGATMQPYDAALVPDPLRVALGVPDRAAQEARLATMAAAMPVVAKP